MQKIKTSYGEYTVEEYITKEVLANKGNNSTVYKDNLVKMCEDRGIETKKSATKEQIYKLLIENGVSLHEFALENGIGVGSVVYQNAFNITHADVKRFERLGILKVVGHSVYRAYGDYQYAPLYDIIQFAEFTQEQMQELLEKYPKGYRRKATKTNEK
jgi:hypothetical protein